MLTQHLTTLQQALDHLAQLLRHARTELDTQPNVPNRQGLIQFWDTKLLPKIDGWRATVADALGTGNIQGNQPLDFALQQIRGLGKDFDVDLSWSKVERDIDKAVTGVVQPTLASLKILHP